MRVEAKARYRTTLSYVRCLGKFVNSLCSLTSSSAVVDVEAVALKTPTTNLESKIDEASQGIHQDGFPDGNRSHLGEVLHSIQ